MSLLGHSSDNFSDRWRCTLSWFSNLLCPKLLDHGETSETPCSIARKLLPVKDWEENIGFWFLARSTLHCVKLALPPLPEWGDLIWHMPKGRQVPEGMTSGNRVLSRLLLLKPLIRMAENPGRDLSGEDLTQAPATSSPARVCIACRPVCASIIEIMKPLAALMNFGTRNPLKYSEHSSPEPWSCTQDSSHGAEDCSDCR